MSCFKEQRYKINASNSQRTKIITCSIFKLFQRAKIQDKCKQFTTYQYADVDPFFVVSKSKDTR